MIENAINPFEIAEQLVAITSELQIPFIFKASFRKANRSKLSSFTGIGDKQALEIIAQVSKQYQIPTVTDIHSPEDAYLAAEYGIDVLQIPAFLCRQTDLLVAAAATGKYVNVKKGQFSSPASMKHAVEKIQANGNSNVMLTDRGTQFGYQDLVVDYRGIPIMQSFGVPVLLDVTHSLQQPNQEIGVTGGQPQYIATLAKAAIAVGVDGLFIETHPDPSKALSDGANMLEISKIKDLLLQLKAIYQAVQ